MSDEKPMEYIQRIIKQTNDIAQIRFPKSELLERLNKTNKNALEMFARIEGDGPLAQIMKDSLSFKRPDPEKENLVPQSPISDVQQLQEENQKIREELRVALESSEFWLDAYQYMNRTYRDV